MRKLALADGGATIRNADHTAAQQQRNHLERRSAVGLCGPSKHTRVALAREPQRDSWPQVSIACRAMQFSYGGKQTTTATVSAQSAQRICRLANAFSTTPRAHLRRLQIARPRDKQVDKRVTSASIWLSTIKEFCLRINPNNAASEQPKGILPK